MDTTTQLAVIQDRLEQSAQERQEMMTLLRLVSQQQQSASTQHALMLQRLESGGETIKAHGLRLEGVEREQLGFAYFRASMEGNEQVDGVIARLKSLEDKDIKQSAIIGASAAIGGVVMTALGGLAYAVGHYIGWPSFK